MKWSPQQSQALDAVATWLKNTNSQQVFRLFGFAGTGKTTLARHLADSEDGNIQFAAFTGKAAKVMRDKGCEGASTIHSLIYDAEQDPVTGLVSFRLKSDQGADIKCADLVIIDECSMVGEGLGMDLLAFKKPVLVLGDPAQLPPVKDGGFFTNQEPDIMLSEIHRQAAESPIIKLATDIRLGGTSFPPADMGDVQIIRKADCSTDIVLKADKILVGTNRTRHAYNQRMRELRGFEGARPQVGETLICLRNDHQLGLLNGGLWEIAKIRRNKNDVPGTIYTFDLKDTDNPDRHVRAKVYQHFFEGREKDLDWRDLRGIQQFNYGYAITTHKAQGSQWDDVCVFDESRAFRDDAKRWLYTACTRASKRLTLVI